MMTDNKYITSLLAQSILDIKFADRFRTSEESASDPGMSPDLYAQLAGQMDRITNFGAFIIKVKHNFLWNDFPVTRYMLMHFGRDVAVFRAYQSTYRSRRFNNEHEKIDSFITFLGNHLRTDDSVAGEVVSNVLAHEATLYRGRKELSDSPAPEERIPGSGAEGNRIPCINGVMKFLRLSIAPDIMDTTSLKAGNLRIRKRKKSYCYWFASSSGQMRIFEVNPGVRKFLELIDGKRTVVDFGDGPPYADLLADLARQDIVYFKKRRDESAFC